MCPLRRAAHNVRMTEASDRFSNIVARAAGNTVGPAVATVLTFAGAVTSNPELTIASVPIGALVGSGAEELIHKLRGVWVEHRVRRFVDEVADQSDQPIDDVFDTAFADQHLGRLMADAVKAAASAEHDVKIRMLAAAFVRGASDPARVDEMQLLVEWLRDLEVRDIRLLAALTFPVDQGRQIEVAARARRTHSSNTAVIDKVLKRKPLFSSEYLNAISWQDFELAALDPGIAKILPLLGHRLTKLGLVNIDVNQSYGLTAVGYSCASLLHDIGSLEELTKE